MNLPPLRDDASTRAGSVADRSRVSSVAEQIHSSYVRASLLRQAEEKKARKVRFYRNGDKFYRGAVFAVSPERFRTFDSLLAELTLSSICDPKLMPNGVRYVFSLDGSRKILSLDELQEGESYVCATLDVFKDIDYTKTFSPTAWHQSSRSVRSGAASVQLQQLQQTPPQSELPPLAGVPRRGTPPAVGSASGAAGLVADGDAAMALAADEATFVECIKPRLITVVRSGPRPRMSVRIPLNKRTARSLEQVLRGVSDIIRLDTGSVRRMYALSGRQVHCLADFFLEDTVFLACGNDRPSSDDFQLDTNEVRLVCAYRFSASTKADRVTLRSQSSARGRPQRHFDTATTDQWSLQMRSQPTSPMVTRRQPRAAAADVRPRPAEECADSPTLSRQPPSVQGSDRVQQEAHSASNSSSEANGGLRHRSAHAATLSAAEAVTDVGAAADANNGVQTGDGDAKILIEQKLDRTMASTAAADSDPPYYDDEERDDRNDVSDNAAAGNVTSPNAGSQRSYAAADAASTATARTDEGGESLPLDDDEHDLSSGDGSGGEDFSEPSADGSVISRTSTGGSIHRARSLDLHADDEGWGVEQPLGSHTKDDGRTRSNDGQGSEQTRQEQQLLPQRSQQQQEWLQQPQPPPRPVPPQPQRRPQQSLANGHVVRDLRPEAGDGRRTDGSSTPEARHESGTFSGRSSSHGNSSSPPLSVANTATVKNAEAESSNLNDPSTVRQLQPQLTLPSASSSLRPEVTAETHGPKDENPAEAAAFAPSADEVTLDAAVEAQSLENRFAVKTGAASDVAAAADHLAGEDAPTSVDTEDVKAQLTADQQKASIASDGATVNGMGIEYSAEAAEGTAVVVSRPADDVASGVAGLGISNQLEDASDAEAVANITMVADSQADKNAHYVATKTKDDEVEVTADHQAVVSASEKVAVDGPQNGVPDEVAVVITAGTDRSEIEIESSAASDRRERDSAAEKAAGEVLAVYTPADEIAHNAASGTAPLAEIYGDATENQVTSDEHTATMETASHLEDKSLLEPSALLESDGKSKGEAAESSGPESTTSAHDVDVVPAEADAPATQNNGNIDAELSGATNDARRERIEGQVESDEEGEELVFGRYKVLRTIADDGSLTIKECVSRDTGRTLALKVVSKSTTSPEELQAISKEARLLRDVNHKNIIGLVDAFETRKAWYIVTDLDEGLDVVSTILTAETYSEADAASLFGDLLNALKYLHSRNVIHGSVCIEKLLIVTTPTQSAEAAPMSTRRRLKLGGFSFAAAVDEAIAAGSKTEGEKHDDDTRVEPAASDEGTRQASTITDLIAAGEVLWTLLTGRAIPEDNRLRQVDINEETANLGVSQEARSLLIALLEARTTSGIHTAEEALSHSWFALATATPNEVSSKYHEDRKEAIAINAKASFSHKRKYSTKATAINILKTSTHSEYFKFPSENRIETGSQDSDSKHLMTESDSDDKKTSAITTEETALLASASDAFSAVATPIGGQSKSPPFTLTSTRDGSVDANRNDEAIGAAASHNGVSVANRLKSSPVPEEEHQNVVQRTADVQQTFSGKADGRNEDALQDDVEEQRSGLSRHFAGIVEDEDEYF